MGKKKKNKPYFLKFGGSLTLVSGHRIINRDNPAFRTEWGNTYPAWRVVEIDQITEEQKQRFVDEYNETLYEDYKFSQLKDPNDHYKFQKWTFEEIIANFKER